MTSLLLPVSYLAPVHYYTLLLKHEKIFIELHEHFPKQTWRNRCSIYGSNGLLHLIIPLHGKKDKVVTKEIRISNKYDWQSIHWRSLESAYRSSPFFEYYENDLRKFYERKFELLPDFNMALQESILKLLGMKKYFFFTAHYEKSPAGYIDRRDCLSKKKLPEIRNFPRYMQVFENKHGFIPNLSIADLLFNLGPQAKKYLGQINPE